MSNRYLGGFITDTPTQPTTSAAPGVWTLTQVAQAVGNGIWPIFQSSDPYFKYVTLLLHGDGTNAAQNNTFVDSSANNYSVSRNGNVTQGTFTPFSQAAGYWSNYFDGSSSLASSANQVIPTGSYTIEAWVFVTSTTSSQSVISQGTSSSDAGRTVLWIDTGFWSAKIAGADARSTIAPVLNTWTHVAMTYNGSTITLWVNGVSAATASITQNASNTVLKIGTNWNTVNFTGYISNVRVVASVVYTSTFTPSTTPLTAITNTSLLTCQNNRFVDNSANNFTLTPSGTPTVQPFSPFAPTNIYSATDNGGSVYSDGTTSGNLTATGTNLSVGTGQFTLEYWMYVTENPIDWRNTVSLGDGTWQANNTLTALLAANAAFIRTSIAAGVTTDFSFANAPIRIWQWNHIAFQRDGTGTILAYCNGKVCSSGTLSGSGVNFNTNLVTVFPANQGHLTGYISNVRLVSGSAIYGSTYTVPTAPLTAITNTQLLLSCTNAGIYDNAIKTDIETTGSAQISTAVKKYGTGSLYFNNNTTNNLIINGDPNGLVFGSGNFTIECWFYSLSASTWQYILTPANTSYTTTGHYSFYIKPTTGYVALDAAASGMVVGTSNVCDGNWHHIAITNSATTIRLFVDGVQQASAASGSTTYGIGGPYRIGSYLATSYPVNGYIDDFRITKGIARYTANFTPPTQAFPNY